MRAILTYHSVDSSGSPISMGPDAFRRQVEWMTAGHVRVASVEDVLGLPDETAALALTFDDGFANFATEVAPLLTERRLPATLFVVTGHVGRDNRWRGRGDLGIPTLPLLDWDALGRLRDAGITLGAHTRTHCRLTGLDASSLEAEVAGAAEELERRLGRRPDGFAYPYGATNAAAVRAAGQYFRWACTTELRPLGSAEAPLRLPRLDAWYFREPGRLEAWGTAEFRAWLWCRRQGRRLRSAVAPRAGR